MEKPGAIPHILIAEDDTLLQTALRDILTKSQFRVSTANNGQEALNIANTDKPDLMLLDIMMPVMDGLTVLQKIKDKPELKNIKVIILTNFNNSETIAKAMEHKFVHYLVKSDMELKDIVSTVKEVLSISPTPTP